MADRDNDKLKLLGEELLAGSDRITECLMYTDKWQNLGNKKIDFNTLEIVERLKLITQNWTFNFMIFTNLNPIRHGGRLHIIIHHFF